MQLPNREFNTLNYLAAINLPSHPTKGILNYMQLVLLVDPLLSPGTCYSCFNYLEFPPSILTPVKL